MIRKLIYGSFLVERRIYWLLLAFWRLDFLCEKVNRSLFQSYDFSLKIIGFPITTQIETMRSAYHWLGANLPEPTIGTQCGSVRDMVAATEKIQKNSKFFSIKYNFRMFLAGRKFWKNKKRFLSYFLTFFGCQPFLDIPPFLLWTGGRGFAGQNVGWHRLCRKMLSTTK